MKVHDIIENQFSEHDQTWMHRHSSRWDALKEAGWVFSKPNNNPGHIGIKMTRYNINKETSYDHAEFYTPIGEQNKVHEELLKSCEEYNLFVKNEDVKNEELRKRMYKRTKCIEFLHRILNNEEDYSVHSYSDLLKEIQKYAQAELALLAVKETEGKPAEILPKENEIPGFTFCEQCSSPVELRMPFGEVCTNKNCNKIQGKSLNLKSETDRVLTSEIRIPFSEFISGRESLNIKIPMKGIRVHVIHRSQNGDLIEYAKLIPLAVIDDTMRIGVFK